MAEHEKHQDPWSWLKDFDNVRKRIGGETLTEDQATNIIIALDEITNDLKRIRKQVNNADLALAQGRLEGILIALLPYGNVEELKETLDNS